MDEAAHNILATSGEDVFPKRANDYDVNLKWLVVVTDVSDSDGYGWDVSPGRNFNAETRRSRRWIGWVRVAGNTFMQPGTTLSMHFNRSTDNRSTDNDFGQLHPFGWIKQLVPLPCSAPKNNTRDSAYSATPRLNPSPTPPQINALPKQVREEGGLAISVGAVPVVL
jgi:hypothetical protein